MIIFQSNTKPEPTEVKTTQPNSRMANTNRVGEIEEEEATPLLQKSPGPTHHRTRSVTTKVPEAEVHVYKQGKGPIDVIKTGLTGWDQDQLEVREILDKHGLKSIFAYTPGSGRGAPIRFNQRNGRSLMTYRDGAVVYVDGEPKDSLLKPITKILLGVALITFMIVVVVKETPEWAKKFNFSDARIPPWAKKFNFSDARIPPWVLACVVIVFTRMRKRTKSFLEKYL